MTRQSAALRSAGPFILDAALHHMAAIHRTDIQEVLTSLRHGDRKRHADYRISIAHMLHAALKPDHPDLRDMKVFGSSLGDEVNPHSDIDLVIHVARKDSEVVDAITTLGTELAGAFQDLIDPTLPDDFELLDLHFVDDRDVSHRRGFAAALTSLHRPGLRLGGHLRGVVMRNPSRSV